jgi:hypothetical protein
MAKSIKKTSGNAEPHNPVNQNFYQKLHAQIGHAAAVFANMDPIAGIRSTAQRGVDPKPTNERMRWFS